jgi:hypothetical protein
MTVLKRPQASLSVLLILRLRDGNDHGTNRNLHCIEIFLFQALEESVKRKYRRIKLRHLKNVTRNATEHELDNFFQSEKKIKGHKIKLKKRRRMFKVLELKEELILNVFKFLAITVR